MKWVDAANAVRSYGGRGIVMVVMVGLLAVGCTVPAAGPRLVPIAAAPAVGPATAAPATVAPPPPPSLARACPTPQYGR